MQTTNVPAETDVVIWGASGHALVVADVIRCRGIHRIAGFIDDGRPHRGDALHGASLVLGGREQLAPLFAAGVRLAFIAVGDSAARLRLADVVEAAGFTLIKAIHPQAVVAASASIGAGTLVVAGAIINPEARIGRNVIVNTGATIDHECEIGDGVHIGPGAHLGGGVFVGRGTWVGIGASVAERIRIGANSIVGAGAAVVRDIPEGVVAYGVPARVMRSVSEENASA